MKRWIFSCILCCIFAGQIAAQSTTTNLGITKPQTGQAQPQVTIATGFDNFDSAVAGRLSKSVAGSSDVTLTTAEARNAILEFTGTLTGSINVIVPTKNRKFIVYNNTTGSYTLTVKTSGGTGVAVTQGQRVWLYCDATNVVALSSAASSATTVTITVANEGSTGTLANGLAKLTGAPSTATRTATSDTGGAIGIVTSGAGTTSNATIQVAGLCSCVFSGATTAGNYVIISDGTAGNCKDGGSSYPTSGQAIGRVLTTNGGAGTYQILLFGPEDRDASGGGTTLADFKDSVRVATTTAGTLSTSFENGDTVDGVTLATGNRILIKDQTTGSENGIYVVAASGAPTRATDADTSAEVTAGMLVAVTEGTSNGDKLFLLTTNDTITLGSTSLTFTAVNSGGGSPAWNALTDPAGTQTLAMGSNLTAWTWAGNYGSSVALDIQGNNTSATGALVRLRTAVSNSMPPLLIEPRTGQSFKADHLQNIYIGKGAIGNTDTDGYLYLPVIGSNLFPSGTPTTTSGFAPVVLESDGINGDYALWGYQGSAWRDLSGQRKRWDTGSGTSAQTINFDSSTSGVVSRQFTLTGNVTFTFSNAPKAGTLISLKIIQDATGGRSVTWPATVKWPGGTPFAPTSTANAKDVYLFLWDGSNYWFISQSQDLQ